VDTQFVPGGPQISTLDVSFNNCSRVVYAEATGSRSTSVHSNFGSASTLALRTEHHRQTRSFCRQFCVNATLDDLDLSVG